MRAAIPAGRGGATGQAATATPAPTASVAMAVEAAMRPSDTPGRRGQTGGSALAHDRARGLVVAQAEEARMAQPPGAGPLGEADLGDELRLDPRHVALPDRAGGGAQRGRAGHGGASRRSARRRVRRSSSVSRSKPVPTLPA